METVIERVNRPAVINVCAAILLLTCSIKAEQQQTHGIREIRFEGTACYGPCPEYKLTIRSDGAVTYEGKENVKETGTKSFSIPRSDFERLARKANEIGFFDLKERYDSVEIGGASMFITDLPSRIITIVDEAGRSKTIEDYWGGPRRLYELEQLIDKTANAAALTGRPPVEANDLPYYDEFPVGRTLKFRGVVYLSRYGGGASANAPKWTSAYMLSLPNNVLQFELRTRRFIDLSKFDGWIVDATGQLTKPGVTGEHVFLASDIHRLRRSPDVEQSK